MTDHDGSLSFYFFDIDDNLMFLPTNLYLWNAERKIEQSISSGEFAAIDLGRKGRWRPRRWTGFHPGPARGEGRGQALAGSIVAAARSCRREAAADRDGERAWAWARDHRFRPSHDGGTWIPERRQLGR